MDNAAKEMGGDAPRRKIILLASFESKPHT
jgi:hypothetical protein